MFGAVLTRRKFSFCNPNLLFFEIMLASSWLTLSERPDPSSFRTADDDLMSFSHTFPSKPLSWRSNVPSSAAASVANIQTYPLSVKSFTPSTFRRRLRIPLGFKKTSHYKHTLDSFGAWSKKGSWKNHTQPIWEYNFNHLCIPPYGDSFFSISNGLQQSDVFQQLGKSFV